MGILYDLPISCGCLLGKFHFFPFTFHSRVPCDPHKMNTSFGCFLFDICAVIHRNGGYPLTDFGRVGDFFFYKTL